MIRSVLSCAALAIAVPAQAAIFTFGAPLLPEGVVSPGTGYTIVTVDDVAKVLTVSSGFQGLLGNTTVAHIHCCTAEPFIGNAGVATTTPTFVGFPVGVTAGAFNTSLDMTLASSWNPAFVTASGGNTALAFDRLFLGMKQGRTYFNIHTSVFGAGEIRSELAAVPEPSTWALMIAGFGLAGLGLRRQRGLSPA